MNDPVVPLDLVRMFIGDSPPLYFLEIAVRTCVIYGYSLGLIRWVGGRGIAQMSTVEFLLVIALGSAVGDAMFYPEVPLLHAMLVITIVILINKALDRLIYKFSTAERIMNGLTTEVVRDGVIDISTLGARNIGHSELFEAFREAGIRNLGEVRRAYLETSGRFSCFRQAPPQPGLPIEPAWSVEPPIVLGPRESLPTGSKTACCTCGFVPVETLSATPDHCPNCQARTWTIAGTEAAR